jgi:hypothetical protein
LTCEEVAGDDDIGKVHTVADQEGLVEEVVVQDLDSHLDDLINPLEDLLNCIMPWQGKTRPSGARSQKNVRIGKVQPLVNKGLVDDTGSLIMFSVSLCDQFGNS